MEDRMTQVTDPQQLTLDERSLCGIKGCHNKAWHLVAWPLRKPVPLCKQCWAMVQDPLLVLEQLPMTPKKWLDWIRQHGKPHIQ